jgi:hypothetical protein
MSFKKEGKDKKILIKVHSENIENLMKLGKE